MSYSQGGGAGSISGSTDAALSNPADGQYLVYNSSVQKWQNGTGVAASGATATVLGTVKLAGDLTGTAAAPTIATGAVTSAKIATGTIVSADISSTAAITASQLDSATQTTLTSVAGKLDSTTATSTYAPKASPTFTGTVTLPAATPTVATQAATKGYVDTQISGVTSSGAPDATTTSTGLVKLAGDLGGTSTTAAAPTLAATTNVNSIISNNSTVTAKATKGANSDITSLTGLTTALSLAQGGTGATSAPAALTALGALASSQKAAASGVASLDGSTLVPRAQLGTGTPGGSTVLYGDAVWRAIPGSSTAYVWTGVKTSAYTAANGDAVICDATAGGFTITLPTNLGANAFVRVKKIDSGVNAVLVASTAQIDGSGSVSLNNPSISQDFSYTGSTWYQV